MTTPVSVARGCEWGGLRPPGAMSTLFIESPRVFSAGNARTFPCNTLLPKGLLVSPSLARPSKKKSFEVTFEAGLQGKPVMEMGDWRSAMQKSCSGSGSEEREGSDDERRRSVEKRRIRGDLAMVGCDVFA